MYQISTMRDTGRDLSWIEWTTIGMERSKAKAIALADAQPIRASVTLQYDSRVIHDNGKPHGGPRQKRLARCSCPICAD